MLVVATAAVSVLVVVSASSSFSYYITPEEYQEQSAGSDTRWRVAGRVVGESIVEVGGRPISFTILGYEGATVEVAYEGGYPSLFGPNTLVIVEGFSGPDGRPAAGRSLRWSRIPGCSARAAAIVVISTAHHGKRVPSSAP